MKQGTENKIKTYIYISIIAVLLLSIIAVAFAFYNYTKIGDTNYLETVALDVQFVDSEAISIGDVSPISYADIDNTINSNFQINAQSQLDHGVRYRVYLIPGDTDNAKTRLLDDVVSVQFTAPADGDGFTTTINNYENPTSPRFVDGKALVSVGQVDNVASLTTKNYNLKLWIDSNKIHVSSTMKRANNAEGNPSLADTTSGNVTQNRYVKNDNNLVLTTLYPAPSEQEGKIIYTTKEFSNSYYSVKVVVEAEDIVEDEELVYLNTNGGTLSTETMTVKVGEAYGTLPTPQRTGYTFLGWNGKNKFNKNNYLLVSDYHGTSAYSISEIYLNPNTTYHLSVIRKNSFDGTGNGYLLIDDTTNGNTHWSAIAHPTQPNDCTVSNCNYIIDDSGLLYVAKHSALTQTNLDTIWSNTDVQVEEGTVATTYEPYYVTSSVTVTQEKDHVLTAIWQKNS